MTDIVFMDTETLGLDPDAPVWEFAAIRRPDGEFGRTEQFAEFTIQHDPTGWLDDFPEEFARDYHTRYDETRAWCELAAALEIFSITRGASVVGAVPSFDTERLAKLLRRNGIEPEWHYQPIDVETVVVGYLAASASPDCAECAQRRTDTLTPPWSSDKLSALVGVDPDSYARHTAMGDVLWARAQWDAVMGGAK